MNPGSALLRNFQPICLYTGLTITLALALALSPVKGHAASHKGPGIVLYSYGPAMIQVVSPGGQRAGQDMTSGVTISEIPGAKIVKEQVEGRPTGWTISLPKPLSGVYILNLMGTGQGGVVLDLDARDRSGKVKNSHIFRRVKKGDSIQLILSYSPDPGSRNKVEERKD
jgi:hypothetical protein